MRHNGERVTGSRTVTTILVVDDDPDVQAHCDAILRCRGYRVLGAASVAEALDLLRASRGIDLIIADYKLGDGTGSELIHQASNEGLFDAELRPALICTAYRYVEPPPNVAVVHKPIDGDDLAQRVDEALRAAARRAATA
jgi:CheY-like chemotaxis protein